MTKDQKKFKKEYLKQSDDKKGYADAVKKWISFCKCFLNSYKSTAEANYDYKNIFNYDYDFVDEFYKDLNKCIYKITFRDIAEDYINQCVKEGKLYLFEIYSKDFSPNTRGRANLQTLYWKALFDKENLKDVVLKLSGEAELFFRPAILDKEKVFVHKKGEILHHKTHWELWKEIAGVNKKDHLAEENTKQLTPEKEGVNKKDHLAEENKKIKAIFTIEKLKETQTYQDNKIELCKAVKDIGREKREYQKIKYKGKTIGKTATEDIIKDKRFTEDKYLFHCPVVLNFAEEDPKYISGKINTKINRFLKKNNEEVNIIGIDRGEKHLLYYSVINPSGDIIKQDSFNTLPGFQGQPINYHGKLDKKEKERAEARVNWQSIENIKELKSGYLSQVVHQLARLIINHNAIVVLEDLNKGFKRDRFKVDKQVYQKFERALIQKLNYLVFKTTTEDGKKKLEKGQAGHHLKAYQLTAPFTSFEKLGKQSGILFYTNAQYTSKVDPVTGYIQNLYPKYTNIDKASEFFKKFKSIKWNGKYFEFSYDLNNLKGQTGSYDDEKETGQLEKTKWIVCSCVQRSKYNTSTKANETFCVNSRLKKLFDKNKNDIKYPTGQCIKSQIQEIQKPEFFKDLIGYFSSILRMRVIDDNEDKGTSENDYIFSPVHPFYDSREVSPSSEVSPLPTDGDANGAYNIARKGIIILKKIKYRQAILNLCEEDNKGKKAWYLEKDKRETLSRTSEQNHSKIEAIFKEWQREIKNLSKAKNLSLHFWQKQVIKNKQINNPLQDLEKEFLEYTNLLVTKAEWQNYSQRKEIVERQEEKWQEIRNTS